MCTGLLKLEQVEIAKIMKMVFLTGIYENVSIKLQ